MPALTPTTAVLRAFDELVASIKVDDAGGDQGSRTVRMHLIGENNTKLEYPESTNDRVYEIGRELFGIAHVRRNFTYQEVVERVLSAAAAAALLRASEPAEPHLRTAYAEI